MEEIFDLTINFWKIHPQFKDIKPFSIVYAQNSKEDSSKYMWFLKYTYHMDSVYFHMLEKEKIKMISNTLFDNKNFYEENKEQINLCKQEYCKVIDTVIDRTIRTIQGKLEEKNLFISDKTYDLETFEDLDKAIISYDKQLIMLHKLYDQRRKDKEAGNKKGDTELSESDKGEM